MQERGNMGPGNLREDELTGSDPIKWRMTQRRLELELRRSGSPAASLHQQCKNWLPTLDAIRTIAAQNEPPLVPGERLFLRARPRRKTMEHPS